MPKPTGYTVYDGPSMIDGRPIVAVLTVKSSNVKTADMAQLWILPKSENPSTAVHTGADASVCGACRHRGTIVDGRNTGRTCYVLVFQGPRSVYQAYTRGRYPVATPEQAAAIVDGKPVRLGAYGDPAALPVSVLRALVARAPRFTGYTHQWQTCGAEYAGLCMASVDSAEEARAAGAAGWRYFRVSADTCTAPNEILCPASKEAGERVNCDRCGLCSGVKSARDTRKNIVIRAHGAGTSKFIALSEVR